MKGIDVAKWNGIIDWQKVKNNGVGFAILKVINKNGDKEPSFENNYAGAKSVGIPVGVYNYSYVKNVMQAKNDAAKVVGYLVGKDIPFKIWLDVEDECQKNMGQKLIDIIKSYQSIIELVGGQFGIYTGLSFYNSYIKPYANQLNCPFWIARYPSDNRLNFNGEVPEDKKPVIEHELFAWQYSSKGQVDGINGNVDLNVCYSNVVASKPTPIPQAKPKNPYIEPSVLLKKGTKSDSVKWLQWELVQAGFGISIDGDFGLKTETAVKSFQKLYNLKVDGIVGGATRSMLKAK